MTSLDPRLNRVDIYKYQQELKPKDSMDQFETYEVFLQTKESKPYQHEGAVHAPNIDMAFLFAKEQFSRRGTCTGLTVVKTEHIMVSPMTDNDESVYDLVTVEPEDSAKKEAYEVFHLFKRGKHMQHQGSVSAVGFHDAYQRAGTTYNTGKTVLNVWVVRHDDMLFNTEDERVIWHTLSEKKFRDAIAYKALDKIKKFKEEQLASK
jgi:ring-1,2-phenylacetyl-CoA epoxidase subunit PaaB